MDTFISAVKTILTNFRENNNDYLTYVNKHVSYGDEAVVRQKLVEPLLTALGYDLGKEVQPEERAGSGSADVYVQAIGTDHTHPNASLIVPACVWELKRTGIHDLGDHEEQLQSYVLIKQVRYGVLTNGHEIRLYERIGERIALSFTVKLTAFAANATTPATEDQKMALIGLYDVLHRESFLDVEKFKQAIITPPFHQLLLSPQHPHNEDGLISELKREIRQLKRLVVLNFLTHQRLVAEFEQEEQARLSKINETQTAVLQAITLLQEKLKLPTETASLQAYLTQLAEKWMLIDEDDFVEGALAASTVEPHLQHAERTTFINRVRLYFQRQTDYRRWRTKRVKKLATSHTLIQDFQQWQEEIGIMATDPVVEFCLQTVYIFITRLLLIRICEDKGIITEKISDGGYKTYLEFSDKFYDYFGHANRRLLEMAYDDTSYIYGHFFSKSVFDWYNWEEETIIRLLSVLNPYHFKEVSADLIGRIYEEYVDELERKRKGQFYTPVHVVGKVLDAADYTGAEITQQKLLDPACGSGRFLVEAMRRLISQWEKAYQKSNQAVDYQELINDRLRHSLFGLDVNRFACFLAEVNLVVQVLDLFKKSYKNFTILRFHIYPTNSLLPETGNGNGRLHLLTTAANDPGEQEHLIAELIKQRWHHPTNEQLDFRSGFDYIVGNPPYVRADNPSIAALRQRITNSNLYPSLYKKWDLLIPFTDLALNLLAENGRHAFIVSDAFQTEEYARKVRQRLLQETTITYLGFAPDVYFFEGAAVFTFIYGVKNSKPTRKHKTKREQYLNTQLSDPKNIRTLAPLSQTKWDEQIFRPEFEGDDGFDLDDYIPLGQLCFINSGLELQSHEKFDPVVKSERQKLFVKDDLISVNQDEQHPKLYVEGDYIGDLLLYKHAYLEWNTTRIPSKLRRSRFPELFENPKIMMGETSGIFYDHKGEYLNNHSVRNIVPYHSLVQAGALDQVSKIMARQITDQELANEITPLPANFEYLSKTQKAALLIKARASHSPHYDLRYLTALLNGRWLRWYMMTFVKRGSRARFYPDDLKKWPVAPASASAQAEIAISVQTIIDAKSDIQSWQQQGHTISDKGISLNPRLLLDKWHIPTGDLLDAVAFVTSHIEQSMTHNVTWKEDKIIFRQSPLSYLSSDSALVQAYLYRYLTSNIDTLYHIPAEQLIKKIRIPKTEKAVAQFMARLAEEELRVTLRWLDATQQENLIEERLFELYAVDNPMREKLSGTLYQVTNIPDNATHVSFLQNEDDTPFKWVAFPWEKGWAVRTPDKMPSAILLWVYDGQTAVTTEWQVV